MREEIKLELQRKIAERFHGEVANRGVSRPPR